MLREDFGEDKAYAGPCRIDWDLAHRAPVACNSKWVQVKLKNDISDVPQGSVLGLLLFVIYVNTIDEGIPSRVIKMSEVVKVFRVMSGETGQDSLQSDKLVERSESVTVRMPLHVRTCKGRSQISRTAEPIVLKVGTVMMGNG